MSELQEKSQDLYRRYDCNLVISIGIWRNKLLKASQNRFFVLIMFFVGISSLQNIIEKLHIRFFSLQVI